MKPHESRVEPPPCSHANRFNVINENNFSLVVKDDVSISCVHATDMRYELIIITPFTPY